MSICFLINMFSVVTKETKIVARNNLPMLISQANFTKQLIDSINLVLLKIYDNEMEIFGKNVNLLH